MPPDENLTSMGKFSLLYCGFAPNGARRHVVMPPYTYIFNKPIN